jgi:hypothetical protein
MISLILHRLRHERHHRRRRAHTLRLSLEARDAHEEGHALGVGGGRR